MEKRFKELRPDPRRKVRPRQENSLQGEKEPYSNPHPRCNDFSDVLDMRTAHHKRLNQEPLPPSFQFIGTTVTKRSIYTVTERPGLYVIPYAVELQQQADFLRRALTEYPQDPHYNNNLVNLGNSPLSGYQPELRWITLGYGYDWTRKAYPLSDSGPRPHVPHEVVQIARALHDDLNSIVPQPRPSTYEPQTAIVNYFPVHSTMMAHQDVSEHCLDRALISISFGCSAIFLMGTDDRNVEPTPLFLRSGDVLIMTGATRTGYHGVPRILDDFPSELYEEVVKQVPIEKDLLQKLRVNINIRQVHEATHDS